MERIEGLVIRYTTKTHGVQRSITRNSDEICVDISELYPLNRPITKLVVKKTDPYYAVLESIFHHIQMCELSLGKRLDGPGNANTTRTT